MNRPTPHFVAVSCDQRAHHDMQITHVEATPLVAHHSPLAQVRRPLPHLPRPSNTAPLETPRHRAHSPIDLPRSVDDEDDLWNFETLLSSYYFDPALDDDDCASSSTHASASQLSLSSHGGSARSSVVERDVRETIRQLEAIADDLRAMDTEASDSSSPTDPFSQRCNSPSAILLRETCALPTNSDEAESTDSHCSSSSSQSSANYHAPILNGALAFHDWHDRDSGISFDWDFPFGRDIPRIMITIPSSDDLADEDDHELCSPQDLSCPWRRARLWDGEPDEVKWVEEYGHWHEPGHSVTMKRRDTAEMWCDSDSDSSSDSSSLFTSIRETSSISTSPPSSPVSPRDSPPSYEKYDKHAPVSRLRLRLALYVALTRTHDLFSPCSLCHPYHPWSAHRSD